MEIEELSLQLRRAYRLVPPVTSAQSSICRAKSPRDSAWTSTAGRLSSTLIRRHVGRRTCRANGPGICCPDTASTSPTRHPARCAMEVTCYNLRYGEADTGFTKLCEDTARGEPDFTQLVAPEHCATYLDSGILLRWTARRRRTVRNFGQNCGTKNGRKQTSSLLRSTA